MSFVKSSKVQMVSQSVYVRIVDKESLWYVVVYTGGIPQWLDTDVHSAATAVVVTVLR